MIDIGLNQQIKAVNDAFIRTCLFCERIGSTDVRLLLHALVYHLVIFSGYIELSVASPTLCWNACGQSICKILAQLRAWLAWSIALLWTPDIPSARRELNADAA